MSIVEWPVYEYMCSQQHKKKAHKNPSAIAAARRSRQAKSDHEAIVVDLVIISFLFRATHTRYEYIESQSTCTFSSKQHIIHVITPHSHNKSRLARRCESMYLCSIIFFTIFDVT